MKIELNLREDIQKYFSEFDYKNCTEPDRIFFNRGDNLTGVQQEAFINYWILKQLKEHVDFGGGLDIGCGQNIHFACLGTDSYYGNNHKLYGGRYKPHITSRAEEIHTKINPETLNFIVASHILEHVKNPVITFRNWCKLLRKDGRIILLMPDAKFEPHPWDLSHINFFTPESFKEKIINTNLDILKIECFNDLGNMFSMNFVGRRI